MGGVLNARPGLYTFAKNKSLTILKNDSPALTSPPSYGDPDLLGEFVRDSFTMRSQFPLHSHGHISRSGSRTATGVLFAP